MFEDHDTDAPRSGVGAFSRFVRAVRADRDQMRFYDDKYYSRDRKKGPLARDFVERIGFQMLTAYRLMRFFDEAGVPLAPKITSRVIRHLYGSDIHYKTRFDEGIMVVHGMGMAISPKARVGSGVILFHHITLGEGIDPETRETGAPTIEDNVLIGPGATLIGPITIGRGSKIMAGAVVTRSVPPGSLVEAPTPEVRQRKTHAAESAEGAPELERKES